MIVLQWTLTSLVPSSQWEFSLSKEGASDINVHWRTPIINYISVIYDIIGNDPLVWVKRIGSPSTVMIDIPIVFMNLKLFSKRLVTFTSHSIACIWRIHWTNWLLLVVYHGYGPCHMVHIIWSISYGPYHMVHVAWILTTHEVFLSRCNFDTTGDFIFHFWWFITTLSVLCIVQAAVTCWKFFTWLINTINRCSMTDSNLRSTPWKTPTTIKAIFSEDFSLLKIKYRVF